MVSKAPIKIPGNNKWQNISKQEITLILENSSYLRQICLKFGKSNKCTTKYSNTRTLKMLMLIDANLSSNTWSHATKKNCTKRITKKEIHRVKIRIHNRVKLGTIMTTAWKQQRSMSAKTENTLLSKRYILSYMKQRNKSSKWSE